VEGESRTTGYRGEEERMTGTTSKAGRPGGWERQHGEGGMRASAEVAPKRARAVERLAPHELLEM
jgi:hypothetical protein